MVEESDLPQRRKTAILDTGTKWCLILHLVLVLLFVWWKSGDWVCVYFFLFWFQALLGVAGSLICRERGFSGVLGFVAGFWGLFIGLILIVLIVFLLPGRKSGGSSTMSSFGRIAIVAARTIGWIVFFVIIFFLVTT